MKHISKWRLKLQNFKRLKKKNLKKKKNPTTCFKLKCLKFTNKS